MAATAKHGKVYVLQSLIEHGVSSHANDLVPQLLAICWVAAQGYVPAVKILLEYGADFNADARLGMPRIVACRGEHYEEVLKILLAHEADVHQQDRRD